MSSGGGGGPTTSTVTNTNLPEYVKPYVTEMLGKAQSLADQPYQQYTGQQTAGINPQLAQGYQQMQNMAPSGFINQAGALSGIGATNTFDNAAAQQYMSPYMQNVVNTQKNQAISDYQRSIPGMNASAARTGGLGGTRNALMRSEAQRNLNNQLSNIQATGSQNAFQNAQNQYNQAQGQLFQGAGLMGQAGQQQYAQQMGVAQGNVNAGTGLRGIEQEALNVPYQNFTNQANYPYQQLGYMSSLIHGLPISGGFYQTNTGRAPNIPGMVASAAGMARGGHVQQKQSGLGSLVGQAAARR